MKGYVSGIPTEGVDFATPSSGSQGKEEGCLKGQQVEGNRGYGFKGGFSEGV